MRGALVFGFLLVVGCGRAFMDSIPIAGGGADGPGANDGSVAAIGEGGPNADAAGPVVGDGCPLYQTRCNGTCISTSVDPANCGGCGVTCAGAEVCSAGACVASCLPGLSACHHRCVDLMTDNANCGACATPCAGTEGCLEGHCEPAIAVGAPPADCAGGGPPLREDVGQGDVCMGGLAQTTFRWAVCSCTDIGVSGAFVTDGYVSLNGPYVPGGLGGGVGTNGSFQMSAPADVGGALWAGATATGSGGILRQELHVGGPLPAYQLSIGADAFVAGDVTGYATTIVGALHVPATATVDPSVSYAGLVREPVTVPPPCDCAPGQLVPIAAIVAARATSNDNALLNLSPAALSQLGEARLDLPCGHYYFDHIGPSTVTIVVHGRTAIYVGGDVDMGAPLRIALDPTAELDMFVAGMVDIGGPFAFGSPAYPALARLYVGSTSGLDVGGGSLLAGYCYVPHGPFQIGASLEIFGGVFAGTFDVNGDTTIHYDRAILSAGDNCGGSSPAFGCATCRDCGNQACVDGACVACTDSSQCCAPLVCTGGTCIDVPG